MAGTTFTTGVGRMVQGDWFRPNTTDSNNVPLVIKSGANAGKPRVEYVVNLAFPKVGMDPASADFLRLIKEESAKAWPHLFPRGASGDCTAREFSDKIIDGDGYDKYGRAWSEREGFAGHWVVRFTSGFAPKVYPNGRYSAADIIMEPHLTPRGYYYRASGTIESNNNSQSPGMYVNLQLGELIGYGPEIIGGPNAAEAFGARPAVLPPGVSATPLAPPSGMPAAPSAPASYAPPAAPSAPVPAYNAAPAIAPYAGYMTPPAAPSAPVAQSPLMSAKANGATYEQMIAAGWTYDLLQSHGMFDEVPF